MYDLAGALERLSGFGFPLETNDVTAAYLEQMSKIETDPYRKISPKKFAQGSPDAMQRVAAASPGMERDAPALLVSQLNWKAVTPRMLCHSSRPRNGSSRYCRKKLARICTRRASKGRSRR